MWKTYIKEVTLLDYGGKCSRENLSKWSLRLNGAAVAVALIDVIRKY